MIPTHKSFSDVKRIFTSFVCVFAVCAAADAQPRCGSSASYMRRHILPPMRHVEMAVAYDECSIVTERTPIPLPEVERVVCTTYVIVDDQPDGLIIDMDALDCPCPM